MSSVAQIQAIALGGAAAFALLGLGACGTSEDGAPTRTLAPTPSASPVSSSPLAGGPLVPTGVAGSGGSTALPSDDAAPSSSDPFGGAAGSPATVGGGGDPVDPTLPPTSAGGVGPLRVAPGFTDLAPPLGEPLPDAPVGQWTYLEIEGATCRDGSPAGLYYRLSDASSNYFVFLEGGGACFDDFFCPLNPKNVNQSVDGESIIQAALLNFGGAAPVPQTPRVDGIFKDDPRNPVAGWNAVYVPYCSGDVYGGTVGQTTVPRWPAGGTQNFTGYDNLRLMGARVVATFLDAEKALLTGSSAGGVGTLVNAGQFADMLAAYTHTRGFIVSDSGPVFDDPYLETCIQKEWRELWGLDAAFPPDCEGCFDPSGGCMVRGLASYLFEKYPDPGQVVGGLISSYNDEIMSMFFSKGLDNCTGNPLYPIDRYRQGLENFRDEMVDRDRFSTYYMAGSFHMHLFQPRFYEENGVGMTIAQWLTRLLDNEATHVAAP